MRIDTRLLSTSVQTARRIADAMHREEIRHLAPQKGSVVMIDWDGSGMKPYRVTKSETDEQRLVSSIEVEEML